MSNQNLLIGYTGFIGSNLKEHFKFLSNSKTKFNQNLVYDDVFISAPSGIKYKCNQNPNQDLENIKNLIYELKNLKCKRVVLISSSDCFYLKDSYGKNRFYLEEQLKEIFKEKLFIFRLAMVFGKNAIKGLAFDFKNKNFNFYKQGIFQFYPVKRLYNDIQDLVKKNIHFAYLSSEGIDVDEILKLFGRRRVEPNKTIYDLKEVNYKFISKEEIFNNLKEYWSAN